MSWFSNRFSQDHATGEESGDEEEQNHGKGVKDDLSLLTKSFTRQLWGVASFLAPPPENINEERNKVKNTEIDTEEDLESSSSDGRLQSHPSQIASSGEQSFSHELVDVDFKGSFQENLNEAEGSKTEKVRLLPHQSSEDVFTGIGKDLAELKGSVATGFSRILKVVRDEIERDDDLAKHPDEIDGDDDDNDYSDENNVNSESSMIKLPGFNTLFRPLLSSILQDDKMEGWSRKMVDSSSDVVEEEEEDDDDIDDSSDLHGHAVSHPSLESRISGISKFASNLFPISLDSDDEKDIHRKENLLQPVGVTDEVLTFARNISMHPETWLDFPLFTEEDDEDEFEMSNTQKEHVSQVESASPRLAALRIELCPDYMSEGRFWKIYFVLLHSRLNKTDAELLSTPQIMEARAALLHKLQKEESSGTKLGRETDENNESSGTAGSFKIVSLQSATEVPAKEFVEEIRPNKDKSETSGLVSDSGEEVQNKAVLANTVKLAPPPYGDEEADADRWLDEQPSPHIHLGVAGLVNEDDVSFSDLEDNDDDDDSTTKSMESKRSMGWVELDNNVSDDSIGRLKANNPGSSQTSHAHLAQESRKHTRSESSDWSTLEDDDVVSA